MSGRECPSLSAWSPGEPAGGPATGSRGKEGGVALPQLRPPRDPGLIPAPVPAGTSPCGGRAPRTRLVGTLQPPAPSQPPRKTCFRDRATSPGQRTWTDPPRSWPPPGPLSPQVCQCLPWSPHAVCQPPLVSGALEVLPFLAIAPHARRASWPLPFQFPLPAAPPCAPPRSQQYSPGPVSPRTMPTRLAALSGALTATFTSPLTSHAPGGGYPPPIHRQEAGASSGQPAATPWSVGWTRHGVWDPPRPPACQSAGCQVSFPSPPSAPSPFPSPLSPFPPRAERHPLREGSPVPFYFRDRWEAAGSLVGVATQVNGTPWCRAVRNLHHCAW